MQDSSHSVSPLADASFKCIAVCTAGELFGGVERHVLEMARSLKARGIGSLFVLFHDGELAAQARERGVELTILRAGNRSLFATSMRLASILERRDIRLVYVQCSSDMRIRAVRRRPYAIY